MRRRPWHCWRCWLRELRFLVVGLLLGWFVDWNWARRFHGSHLRITVATFWLQWRCHHWPFFIAKGYDMDCPHEEGAE